MWEQMLASASLSAAATPAQLLLFASAAESCTAQSLLAQIACHPETLRGTAGAVELCTAGFPVCGGPIPRIMQLLHCHCSSTCFTPNCQLVQCHAAHQHCNVEAATARQCMHNCINGVPRAARMSSVRAAWKQNLASEHDRCLAIAP